MKLIYGYCCEQGRGRAKKQDFMLFKLIKLNKIFKYDVCIAAVCDGVGSFENSEFASGTVGNSLNEWFDRNMYDYKNTMGIKRKSARIVYEELKNTLREELWLSHKIITDETETRNIHAATTVCVMITVGKFYCIYSSGDSRVYEISNDNMRQLTIDQVVNIDGRNVLSNCIGCFPGPNLFKLEGKVRKNTAYMLSTDGYYRKLNKDEAKKAFIKARTCEDMQNIIAAIREYELNAGERDDSTGIALKFI